jgi:predicted nucleotidyltransferase
MRSTQQNKQLDRDGQTCAKPRGPRLVPRTAIQRLARQIAQQFQPERIILFGSYAYGKPDPESDVDLLVVMPARNEISQAIRIRLAVEHPFALDLIVRTPERLRRRLELGDWFLREIVSQGKVLYEKVDGRVGSQSRGRPGRRRKTGQNQTAPQ